MLNFVGNQLFTVHKRMADALDRLAPLSEAEFFDGSGVAFVWDPESNHLNPVKTVNRLDIDLLKGIETSKNTLLENTRRFAKGLPANNALLWGARGTGKSSLVKAVHGAVVNDHPFLSLIEIHREDISSLVKLLPILREDASRFFILFCDDLSFETMDTSYKSLKALLEGGIEGRPKNVIFYATSNRRHLLAVDRSEEQYSGRRDLSDVTEERVSLSDRFGLWLGFHNCDQATFLEIVDSYSNKFGISMSKKQLHNAAIEWSVTRGARSGRVAWQFIQEIAGQEGISTFE